MSKKAKKPKERHMKRKRTASTGKVLILTGNSEIAVFPDTFKGRKELQDFLADPLRWGIKYHRVKRSLPLVLSISATVNIPSNFSGV